MTILPSRRLASGPNRESLPFSVPSRSREGCCAPSGDAAEDGAARYRWDSCSDVVVEFAEDLTGGPEAAKR